MTEEEAENEHYVIFYIEDEFNFVLLKMFILFISKKTVY